MHTARTPALETFIANLDQSFLLARVIRRGGLFTLLQPFGILRALATQDTRRLEGVNTLTRDTVPAVLLTYLITIFEAYWEDLALTICIGEPQLLDHLEGKMRLCDPKGRRSKPGSDTEERVQTLFQGRCYDTIGAAVWERGLGIPFTAICGSAQTSPRELDYAKAIRNLHIHRQGRADSQFVERVDATAISEGDLVPIPIELAVETMRRLHAIAPQLDGAAIARFPAIVRRDPPIEYERGK